MPQVVTIDVAYLAITGRCIWLSRWPACYDSATRLSPRRLWRDIADCRRYYARLLIDRLLRVIYAMNTPLRALRLQHGRAGPESPGAMLPPEHFARC